MSEIQKFFEWKNLYQFLQTNLLKIFIIIVVFKISSMLKKHIDRVIKSLLEKSSIDKSVASFLR